MPEPVRIVIADDHPLFREGVAHSLASAPDLAVVGQAGSGEEAFELVASQLPDVLLLDFAMPGEGGIAATRRIAAAYPVTHIVMLTVSEDHADLMQALQAGARGYVLKGVSAKELVSVVRTVAEGEVYISRRLAGDILFEMTHDEQAVSIDQLTVREREILQLVSEGMTNRRIGERLHLAEKTIKHYMTNVLQKLQVRSRVEAALLAQKHGLKSD